jgi:uncharacterized membrane protein
VTTKRESLVATVTDLSAVGGILGFFSLVVAVAWSATPFAQSLAAIAFCCAVAHAIYGYGLRDALALLLFCFLVTFTVENIGVVTGLPFGHYHFEVGASLPHLGVIPLVVGVLWFGMDHRHAQQR